MSRITALCDQIAESWRRLGVPFASALKPGLSRDRVMEVDRQLPVRLPESVFELYGWHNGMNLDSLEEFFPGWSFISIDDALDRYHVLCKPHEGFAKSLIWESDWFPVFSATDISTIGVVCSEVRMNDQEVSSYDHTASCGLEYSSLQKMLEVFVTAFSEDLIYIDIDNRVEIRWEDFQAVKETMCPGYNRYL